MCGATASEIDMVSLQINWGFHDNPRAGAKADVGGPAGKAEIRVYRTGVRMMSLLRPPYATLSNVRRGKLFRNKMRIVICIGRVACASLCPWRRNSICRPPRWSRSMHSNAPLPPASRQASGSLRPPRTKPRGTLSRGLRRRSMTPRPGLDRPSPFTRFSRLTMWGSAGMRGCGRASRLSLLERPIAG